MNGRRAVKSPALIVVAFVLLIVVSGCGRRNGTTTPTSDQGWVEEELAFMVGPNELHGVLTSPTSKGSHSALVIAAPSVGPEGGQPSGVSDQYATDLAHRLAAAGYAAFRYDSPGVGRSGGQAGYQSMQAKSVETLAALHRVQEHPAVQADRVGLWGSSQGAWVVSMAAADRPNDVAFVIAVSGSGVSVAEQQIYGIDAQSRAAGLGPDDVDRATLFGRLLIDFQLTNPLFRDMNEQVAQRLGPGPWQDFLPLVYQRDTMSPADGLNRAIEILASIKDEPWAKALYLENVVLPALQSIPPDQITAVRAAAAQSLLVDPRDQLTKVTSPLLAFFGETDVVQPTDRSAVLYRQYLEEAGNDDVTIVVLPEVGHDIVLSTPGYWDRMVRWLDDRRPTFGGD